MSPFEILKKYFGYEQFREGQENLINNIIEGQDCLGIMPTGAGKSLCYQVPALMLDGITLIVSPLISLMKDQVNALTQAGVAVAYINSSLTERQISLVLERAKNNAYKLIYIAPERLLTYEFLELARNINISMLTVDEAHCISQWGQDFRPSYAKIPEFLTHLTKRPIITAFTATATQNVQKDVVTLLKMNNPYTIITGFDRENLYFEVQKPKNKFDALLYFLQDKKEVNGIVYCSTRKNVEQVCENLNSNGYNASRYHAGLSDNERNQNQEDFIYDRIQIMVATNAFGMGIDKSNVRFVVHYNMPKDVESYYQEAGRAGRDGEPSDCVLFYSGQDVQTHLWLIDNGKDMDYADKIIEKELKENDRKRLKEMTMYCVTNDCLRSYILKYFGESPLDYCGNCGNCISTYETVDVTIEAQKILSCVYRMKERYGIKLLIDVLIGSTNKKLLELDLDKLSTYGISQKTERELQNIINHLILNGYINKTNDQYPIIKLTEQAKLILSGDKKIMMKLSKEEEKIISRARNYSKIKPMDKELFEILRNLRKQIANEQKVPAFVIFSDSTLTDMCMKIPQNLDDLLSVTGVGQVKLERYGDQFISTINNYLSKKPNQNENIHDESINREIDISTIEISEDAVTISIIADRINSIIMQSGYKRLTGAKINDWLVSKGYMEKISENTKNFKIPTEQGKIIGISFETRVIRGESVKISSFEQSAQKFIVERLFEILKNDL